MLCFLFFRNIIETILAALEEHHREVVVSFNIMSDDATKSTIHTVSPRRCVDGA